jgi:hypothetical protein
MIPKPEKYTKLTQNVTNSHNISQMSVEYSKRPKNISTFSSLRPSKVSPNWYFWFENKPSGNPVIDESRAQHRRIVQTKLCPHSSCPFFTEWHHQKGLSLINSKEWKGTVYSRWERERKKWSFDLNRVHLTCLRTRRHGDQIRPIFSHWRILYLGRFLYITS